MAFIVINRLKILSVVALISAIAIGFYSGWREVGIDREGYLLIHMLVSSSDSIVEKIFFSKDVMFLVAISLASIFSSDPKSTFLLVCLTSVIAKYFAVRRVAPQYLLGFAFIYFIFLSPGLEFAAMRGALSIGFFMLALTYSERLIPFSIFSLLSVASHIAILPAILFAYSPINFWLARHKFSYLAIIILISLFASNLIEIFPRGIDYENNRGNLLAYALPTATLVVSFLIFYCSELPVKNNLKNLILPFVEKTKPVIFGLISISFAICGAVVTASTRYLEIVWCLLIIPALVFCRRSWINFFGLIAFIIFLSYLNIVRFTWLAVVKPSLF